MWLHYVHLEEKKENGGKGCAEKKRNEIKEDK
jgi:hypothetical protein